MKSVIKSESTLLCALIGQESVPPEKSPGKQLIQLVVQQSDLGLLLCFFIVV
jgi:hypothetical protein